MCEQGFGSPSCWVHGSRRAMSEFRRRNKSATRMRIMVIQRGNMKRSRCFVEGALFCRSGLFVLLFLFPLSLLCRSLTLYDFSKSPDPALIQSYDGAWKWLSEAGRLDELGPKGIGLGPLETVVRSLGSGNCAVVGADVWNTGTETSDWAC